MFHAGRILPIAILFAVLVGYPSFPVSSAMQAQANPSESQAKPNQEQPLLADFGADRVEIKPEMEIQFDDESTGTATSWAWDFGDGTTTTEQNPKHVYMKDGYYTVILKITGPKGSDTVKKVDFIRVSEDCKC